MLEAELLVSVHEHEFGFLLGAGTGQTVIVFLAQNDEAVNGATGHVPTGSFCHHTENVLCMLSASMSMGSIVYGFLS